MVTGIGAENFIRKFCLLQLVNYVIYTVVLGMTLMCCLKSSCQANAHAFSIMYMCSCVIVRLLHSCKRVWKKGFD